jgi:hypothetical protein
MSQFNNNYNNNPPSSSRSEVGNEFLTGQFQNTTISPEMLNFGLSAGQDLVNRQKAKWMPGVSDFWSSLKIYFAVSNSYVLKKLFIILYPMQNQNWGRIPADEVGGVGDQV